MSFDIKPAETEADREAVYRLRYEIYVDEMNRYRAVADHQKRWLKEPVDEHARLFIAKDGATVAGTMRLVWGGDAPFSERHIEQYDLESFLAEVPPEQIVIGERFMAAPACRGGDLIIQLFIAYLAFVNEHRIQLMFGHSEPYLLNRYLSLGFRTYTKHHINSAETGYLIPLVMVPEDTDYMRAIDSPLAAALTDFGADARVPDCVANLIAAGSAVKSETLTPSEIYREEVRAALNLLRRQASLFDGMNDEELGHCLSKSNVIDCRKGDCLIKQGNVAKNMYVVLSGTLEVRDGDRVIAEVESGGIVGEMAFLLESPRISNVYALSETARVLSLSENTVRTMIADEPEIAAKMLLNLSKILCHKVLRTGR